MTFTQNLKLQFTGFQSLMRRHINRLVRLVFNFIASSIGDAAGFYTIGIILGGDLVRESINFSSYILPGLLISSIIAVCIIEGTYSFYLTRNYNELISILGSPLSIRTVMLSYVCSGCLRGIINGGAYLAVMVYFTKALPVYPLSFALLVFNVMILSTMWGIRDGVACTDFSDAGAITSLALSFFTTLSGGIYNVDDLRNMPIFSKLVYLNPLYYLIKTSRYFYLGIGEPVSFTFHLVFLAVNLALFFILCEYADNHKNIRG